ncbi:MAG: hypothetical protein WC139_07100 [Candidatus Kapaibacterium sp.]
MSSLNQCTACHAAIAFLKTKSGKPMPVNIETVNDVEKQKLFYGEDVPFEFGRHISHFATCPEAKKFRKGKKS